MRMTHVWWGRCVGWCETLGVPVSQLIGTMYGRDCSIIIREALIRLFKTPSPDLNDDSIISQTRKSKRHPRL